MGFISKSEATKMVVNDTSVSYDSNAAIDTTKSDDLSSSTSDFNVETMDLSIDDHRNDNNIAMKYLKNYGDNLKNKVNVIGNVADTAFGALKTGAGEVIGGWAYITGNMSSQDVDSVMADIKQDNNKHTITNALTNVVDSVEDMKEDTLNTAIDVSKEFTSSTKDVLTGKMSVSDYYDKTKATEINLTVGVVEGVGNWGEKIYDTINLKSNYYIGKADVALGIRTQEQYDQTMATVKEQVADDQTKYIYDWFYGDTKLGQNIQEKSFATNEVRTTGNMAGEVGMNIGMAYVGGELAGSSSVVSELGINSQKAAQIGSKVFAASSAGATGYGEAASNAYKSGATIEEGMIAGEVNGAVRAAQYAIGGKINETNPFANQVSNSALHVGLDAVDGASDALIQPAVELIYKDGTYDTNGNYVKFDEAESITSKYSKVFNENGGWNTVVNSAKTGAIFSAASEAGGVAKYFKYDDNGATKNAINSVENTTNVSGAAKQAIDIDDSSKIISTETTKAKIDTDTDVKVKETTNIVKVDTDTVDPAVDVANNLYKKGYNIDEINEMTKGYTDTDFKNLLENMDSIPSKLDYVGFNQYKDTKITKDQMVKGIDSLAENYPAYKQQLEEIKQNLGDVKYVSDAAIRDYSSVVDKVIENDWNYLSFTDPRVNVKQNISGISNFSNLELQADGTYKYSQYDVGKIDSENMVKYMLSNDLDLDTDAAILKNKTDIEANGLADYYKTQDLNITKFNGTKEYIYQNTDNIVKDCKDLLSTGCITDAEKNELSSYYNEMLSKKAEIDAIKSQSTNGITKDNYEKLSAAYDDLLEIESKASKINNSAWVNYGSSASANPTFVHTYSQAESSGCPSYKDLRGPKICTSLSSNYGGTTFAYEGCGVEFKIDDATVKNIDSMRCGDAGSWDYSNDRMIDMIKWDSLNDQQINGNNITYELGDHSKLVSPEKMTQALYDINNKTLSEFYTEIVLKNDGNVTASNYFITDTTPDSIVNQMKELAKNDGLPLYKIDPATNEKVEVPLD